MHMINNVMLQSQTKTKTIKFLEHIQLLSKDESHQGVERSLASGCLHTPLADFKSVGLYGSLNFERLGLIANPTVIHRSIMNISACTLNPYCAGRSMH